MREEHTPAPWEWDEEGRFLIGPVGHLPTVLDCRIPPSEPNARLIAVAPELLEACEQALAELTNPWPPEDWESTIGRLRAAIAKAK